METNFVKLTQIVVVLITIQIPHPCDAKYFYESISFIQSPCVLNDTVYGEGPLLVRPTHPYISGPKDPIPKFESTGK